MADIKLGQSIAGSFTSNDPKITDANSSFKNNYYDEYNITGLDQFTQLTIKLDIPAVYTLDAIELINASTGAIINYDYYDYRTTPISAKTVLLPRTTSPNINYKVRISGSQLGDYTLSIVDGGKATSIVSTNNNVSFPVGTIGASGIYFPLTTDVGSPSDIALAPDGQLYEVFNSFAVAVNANTGVVGSFFESLNPGIANQIDYYSSIKSPLKDTQGSYLSLVNALEFAGDKLYAINRAYATVDKLYEINVTSKVATLVGSLPKVFASSGDLVYDAANAQFFATSTDTSSSDALWKIPIANPSGATKIGQIGFTNVQCINFVNGQLTGFSYGGANQISINTNTGAGTLGQKISGITNITGAATITYPSSPPANQVPLADFKKDPAKYMGAIRDYDGNDLGGSSTWKSLGEVEINGDGKLENILVNPKIERFASVGSVDGTVDFTKNGLNGDTRVVGIYIDPTLLNSPEKRGGPFDSQRRFQNDLKIDNLKVLAAADYNHDGFQDLYFKLGDGSAVLRALMFKDGNIQYANYQSKSDLAGFMTANNVSSLIWGSWI
jgi:hypothetical protein